MNRILPVILILIAVGIFFGYVNPEYTGPVADLKTEIKSYDGALKAAALFKDKEEELMTERSRIPEEGVERIEAFLPDSVDNVQLILDLNALAERSGLTLSDFDVTSSQQQQDGDKLELESESPVEALQLSLSATGNYQSFKTFLRGAELSLRPLDLTELTIADSATGVYTYSMTFHIYWLR